MSEREELIAALNKGLEFAVLFLAFSGRDRGTDRLDHTLDGLEKLAVETDAAIRAALATPEPAKPVGFRDGIEAAAKVIREDCVYMVGRIQAEAIAKKIEALAPPAGAGEGWQTMDTAPKDGTEVLCLAPEYKGPVMLRWNKRKGKDGWHDWEDDTYNPTAWFPLPAAHGDGGDTL